MSTTLNEPAVDFAGDDQAYELLADDPVPVTSRRRAGAGLPQLPPLSPVPTYIGIAVAIAGFVLIAFAWGKVAGIADNVALQVPYLVSGGLTGLGLVMVGVTIVNVAAKRRDTMLRQQQTQLLADALAELRNALER